MEKPGYKTTEFWLTLAATVVGLLFTAGVVAEGSTLEKVLALAASVLGALGYTVARAKVKSNRTAAEMLTPTASVTVNTDPT